MPRLLRAFLPSCLLSLFLLVPAGPAAAAVAGDLYTALVPVSDQSGNERKRAVSEAFRQVLVKVAGQRSVLELPAVQAELSRADALLAIFRYETAPGRDDGRTGALQLRLAFDPAGVRNLLSRAAAPVWSADRPPVHLWMARGGEGRGNLFVLGTPQADVLLAAAELRGLPVVLPGPGDTVAPAGTRVALLGTLGSTGGLPAIEGVLQVDGGNETLQVAAVDEASALKEAVEQAADRLAARYAVAPRNDQAKTLRLRLKGIGGLEAWAGVQRWLQGQPLVKEVSLDSLSATEASLLLVLAGDATRLAQAMRADNRFASVGTPLVEGHVQALEATLAGAGGKAW